MNNKKIDIPICVCVELKTVMVISASIKINPHELFEKLEYILKVEHDVSTEDKNAHSHHKALHSHSSQLPYNKHPRNL